MSVVTLSVLIYISNLSVQALLVVTQTKQKLCHGLGNETKWHASVGAVIHVVERTPVRAPIMVCRQGSRRPLAM